MGESRAVRTKVRANVGGSAPPPPPDLARMAALGPEFLKTVEHLRGLQFGGITSFLGDVGKTALAGVGKFSRLPGVKQVGEALEFERGLIGEPIAETLLGRPLQGLRALGVPVPKQFEEGLVSVGSSFLTPSSVAFFLIPFGRAFQAGKLVGGQAAGAAVGRVTAAEAARTSRLGLRQLFAPSTRQTARIMVAERLRENPQRIIQRAIKEPKISAEIDFVENQLKGFRKTMSPKVWKRWVRRLNKADRDALDFGVEALFGKISPRATSQERVAFFQNQEWLSQFLLDDGIDPRHLTDHTGIFGRMWNTVKALPGSGGALKDVRVGKGFASGFADEARTPNFAAAVRTFDKEAARINAQPGQTAFVVRGAKEPLGDTASIYSMDDVVVKAIQDNTVGLPTSPKAFVEQIDAVTLQGEQKAFVTRLFEDKGPLGGPPRRGVGAVARAVERGVTAAVRPIMLKDDIIRRPWLGAAAIAPGFNQAAAARSNFIATNLERFFGADAVTGGATKLRYIGPSASERAASALRRLGWEDIPIQRAEASIKGVQGKMLDVIEHPEFYQLSKSQQEILERVQFILNADRDEALAMGVNIGAVNENYISHRISQEALGVRDANRLSDTLGRALNQPKYAGAFRHRRYDADGFIIRAEEIGEIAKAEGFTLTGPGAETNIARLLDWRLGAAAKKKVEQLFFRRLAANPETRMLVQHRRFTFRGKTVVEEAARELDPKDAAQVIESFEELLPLTSKLKIAETRSLKDLSLTPPSRLTGKAHELARQADDLMKGQLRPDGSESIVSKGLDFMRSVLLSADISPIGMIQGVRNFSADPASWFAQMGEAAAWMTTKHGKRAWAIQNLPNIRYATRMGLTLGNVHDIRPEMLARMTIGIFGQKVPTPLSAMGWMNKQLMDMVQVAKLRNFNTMLGAFAIAQRSGETATLIRGLPWFRKAQRDLGPGWREAQFDDVARAVSDGLNNAIGPIDFNLVNQRGVSDTFERFLILTPSWTRGNIGQIINISKAGPKGVVARWLLMNQLGTGAFLASKLSMTLSGEMPSFDPRDNDFLSVRLPWGRFNVLPAMPIYRLPARLLLGRDDFGDFEQRQAEFLRFAETRMGQVPRIAIDLVQGQDFLGRKIDNKSLFFAKELLPILGQEIIESIQEGGVSDSELAQRLALEATGSVVIPKTPFQLERERVEELEGIPFDEVPRAKLRRLRKSDGVLRELRERQRAYRAERGGPLNQFFDILEERTEKLQTAMDEFIRAKPPDTPGFMAAFQEISAEELQSRAVAAEAAKEALGIEEGDIADAPERILRDVLAIDYWTVRPALESCRIADDPDACEDEAWTAFREERQGVLDRAPSDEIRRYIVEEFSATRYAGNEVAENFERRRVLAQIASSDFFDASPYILPTGEEVPDDLLAEVFEVRKEANALINQLGISVFNQTEGEVSSLPSGTRRQLLTFLLQRATTPLRRTALAFQILWESKAKDFLRNPRRDAILLENSDMIKFRPDVFGRFIRRREILANFADDPEILRIAAEGG